MWMGFNNMYQKCLHVYFTGISYIVSETFFHSRNYSILSHYLVLFIECVIYVLHPFYWRRIWSQVYLTDIHVNLVLRKIMYKFCSYQCNNFRMVFSTLEKPIFKTWKKECLCRHYEINLRAIISVLFIFLPQIWHLFSNVLLLFFI